jgi:hypothetical protein
MGLEQHLSSPKPTQGFVFYEKADGLPIAQGYFHLTQLTVIRFRDRNACTWDSRYISGDDLSQQVYEFVYGSEAVKEALESVTRAST